jgi:hypothetical protein
MTAPPSDPAPSAPQFPFSPQEAMEFMQKMWNPFGIAMPAVGIPGMPGAGAGAGAGLPFANPAALLLTLDPAELERKIGELRVVEGWLQMSLNLMQMSIRTMELQKASLEALRSTHAPPSAEASAPAGARGRRKR